MFTRLISSPARFIGSVAVAILVFLMSLLFINEYAVARASRRIKDIAYLPTTAKGFDPERHILDIYTPRQPSITRRPVIVFIHGGNWNTGNKNLYAFLGRRLAKQGIVAVLINYRLSPAVEVPAMADDCAQAVRWVTQHIAEYGGDPNRLFVMGHSAGGGFAALLATDKLFFTRFGLPQNPIKGAILDDPAGLDMFNYLTKMQYSGDEQYLIPFGKNPSVWQAVSALYHVDSSSPPIAMYIGEKTYPSIIKSTKRFEERLQQLGVTHELTIMTGKKHVGMVTQLFWGNNRIYRDLVSFVGANR